MLRNIYCRTILKLGRYLKRHKKNKEIFNRLFKFFDENTSQNTYIFRIKTNQNYFILLS